MGMEVFLQKERKTSRRPQKHWRSDFWPQNCSRRKLQNVASSCLYIYVYIHICTHSETEMTILIKFAFWRGLGCGAFEGKLSKSTVFLGDSMTIKLRYFASLIVMRLFWLKRTRLIPEAFLIKSSVNIFKTTPAPPNKNGSYGIKVGVRMA